MFGLSSFRLYAAIFALVALVALVAGGYIYVTKMQTKITTLEVESRLAQEALKTSNETIDAIEKAAAENRKNITELREGLDKATDDQEELRKVLANNDLKKLANRKPGLIERKINDATAKEFRDFERITGR